MHNRIPVLEITLARSSISWLLSLTIARSQNISPIFGSRTNLIKLFCRGLFGASAMTAYYVSLQALPLADAVTLFFLNPPLTAVLAWAIRGEPLSITGGVGCLASFLGVILLAHPPFLFGGHASWGPARVLGTVAGLLSALLGAAAFISIRYIGRSEPALVVATWFHTATLMISSIPLAAGWPDKAVVPSVGDAALLVAVALSSFSAQLYLTRGFQLESATRASATNFTQVRAQDVA
jgi:drug/metabolite transporter (DMT)-like permease